MQWYWNFKAEETTWNAYKRFSLNFSMHSWLRQSKLLPKECKDWWFFRRIDKEDVFYLRLSWKIYKILLTCPTSLSFSICRKRVLEHGNTVVQNIIITPLSLPSSILGKQSTGKVIYFYAFDLTYTPHLRKDESSEFNRRTDKCRIFSLDGCY